MSPYYLFGIAAITLAAISQTLLKKSALRTYESRIREYVNPYVITGYGLLGISMLLTLVCYRYLGYMQAVILEPAGYVLVMLLGHFIFRELVTARKIAGMVMILAGIVLFHLG